MKTLQELINEVLQEAFKYSSKKPSAIKRYNKFERFIKHLSIKNYQEVYNLLEYLTLIMYKDDYLLIPNGLLNLLNQKFEEEMKNLIVTDLIMEQSSFAVEEDTTDKLNINIEDFKND